MKGIILAGGSGTRLYPITKGVSKQLLPVYDKPMIYYPLSTLMQADIKDILVITTKEDQLGFKRLLGDGSELGVNINYTIQPSPDGLAQAFLLGEDFIGDDECAMVLGDNIYFGDGFEEYLQNAKMNSELGIATIFGCQVPDPERFGIVELGLNNTVLSVEEKPLFPKSNYAITGLYFYPKGVSEYAKRVKPSKRNELEITSLNDMYLKDGRLKAEILGDGFTWFDAGLFDSLNDASNLIKSVEKNRGKIISSPEAIAFEKGWITEEQLSDIAEVMKKNSYGKYLSKMLESKKKKTKILTLNNKE